MTIAENPAYGTAHRAHIEGLDDQKLQDIAIAERAWDIAQLIAEAREDDGDEIVVYVVLASQVAGRLDDLAGYLAELGYPVEIKSRRKGNEWLVRSGPPRRRPAQGGHQRPRSVEQYG